MVYKRINVNHRPEGHPWVKMGCHRRPGGYGQIKLSFSPTIVSHLGISDGDKLEVFRGEGDHDGWIAVTRGPNGFGVTNYKQGANVLAMKFSCRYLGIEEPHTTTKIDRDGVMFDTEEFDEEEPPRGWVHIELPEWARTTTDARVT